ncbi:UNVERIFIED_CONTAM: hypothetical protein Sindi_0728200 [Sesamum indicum]
MKSVAIFLQTVGLSERQRTSCERFQHSLETISRHMKRVSQALNLLAPELICPPNFNHIHLRILNNTHFFPYFKDCVGAIDGTLITASVPMSRQNAYRSRHGDISQNVMAVCDFDLMFTYVMAGWEGSANDARVFMDCLNNDLNFPWPPNGITFTLWIPLIPIFLDSWRRTVKIVIISTPLELRNVIEWAFGVLKNGFPILKGPMLPYSLDHQRDLVIACCVIHNFIRKFGIDDQFFERRERGEFDDPDNEANDQFRRLPQQSQQDIDTQAAFRDAMAGHLWNDRETGNDNND